MKSKIERYPERVLACWLGKAVGGTLGIPTEGKEGPLRLTFYDPIPTTMLPNDDLDLQVLWACKLDELGDGIRVDRDVFADAWLHHVSFPWDEYGVAIRNLKSGLRPPLSGNTDNWFANGMGAAIRSEIWACLAPGNPELAAQYAYEDACVDHAGDGIWAEVFLAALESMAFVESNPATLLDIALAQIPTDGLLRHAIADTASTWARTRDWQGTMQRILQQYGHENFTDVTMNLAFTVLGWLAGEENFSRAICTAVNCGKDTDCTGATVGSLMGILNPECISKEWLRPIGHNLVVDARITGINPPATIEEFANLICRLRERLAERPPQRNHHLLKEVRTSIMAEVWPVHSPLTSELPPSAAQSPARLDTSGYWFRPDSSFWTAPQMAVRYRFNLATSNKALIMFNTHRPVRVWCDGVRIIQSKGQPMAPSFHRPLIDQYAKVDLAAGGHDLIALIDAPADGDKGDWIWGVGDAHTHQWLALEF